MRSVIKNDRFDSNGLILTINTVVRYLKILRAS